MRRALITAFLLLLGSAVLGATVMREPIAHAASAMSVFVSNAKTNPIPVAEQNLDTNGNIKVHEQGTATVTVANPSLPASTNRLTVAMENLDLTGSAQYSPWIDTNDCKRVVAIVRHTDPDLVVRLLASANPSGSSPSADDLDASYKPSEIDQGTSAGAIKETYYFETASGSSVIAPKMSLEFFSSSGGGGTVTAAWLYCVR
jgi:hypothetical protein